MHHNRMLKIFVPHKIKHTQRRFTEDSFKIMRTRIAKKWAEREKLVLNALTKTPTPRRDIKVKLDKSVFLVTLRRLKSAGKVKQEGWSKSARWSLA